MDSPLVSVIMPAYNAERYIAQAIESVIAQSYKNWELIIVDDGSTDNSAAIIKGYCEQQSKIVYLHQSNGKQGKARNLGISRSKGVYIAFLDADDLWTAEKLQFQISCFNERQELDLLFSQGHFLHEQTTSNFNVEIKATWNLSDLESFINGNKIPIASVMLKKKAILKVGGFSISNNTQFGEDYLLWLKLLSTNHIFSSVNQRLFYYRIHGKQATKNNKLDHIKLLDLYIDFYHYYKDKDSHRAILKKVKWGILEETNADKYFNFCYTETKKQNRILGAIIRLTKIVPFKTLRNKLILRLF